MNEHIKTGSQIHSDVVMDSHYRRVGEKHKKWVDLEWLREQIRTLRQHKEVAPEYYDAIKEVLSLMEEDKMKKKTEQKEEPNLISNEVGVKFDVEGFRKHLQEYNSWVLGFHLIRNPHMNIIDHCCIDLMDSMAGKVPFNFVDGCGWIHPTKAWIEHQWRLKLTVDYIWDGIKKDDATELAKCDLKKIQDDIYGNCNWKKKHWWQR